MILTKMRPTAKQYLNKKANQPVVTVATYSNGGQREVTKDAGQIVNLDVPRPIKEPTAAARAHGLERPDSLVIAVYDLVGGGDFDIYSEYEDENEK